jgi:hypothetical protein
VHNTADHATVIDAVLATYVRRQMRLDLPPLIVVQPKQIGPHPLLRRESSDQANQQPIQATTVFIGF